MAIFNQVLRFDRLFLLSAIARVTKVNIEGAMPISLNHFYRRHCGH